MPNIDKNQKKNWGGGRIKNPHRVYSISTKGTLHMRKQTVYTMHIGIMILKPHELPSEN